MSRAHPQKKVALPVPQAIQQVLEHIKLRQQKTTKRWVRNKKQREKKGLPVVVDDDDDDDDGGPYRPVNETIELAVNLNLDPRKPGQSLRGSMELPYGTGKRTNNVVVFTTDTDLIARVQEQYGGGGGTGSSPGSVMHVGGEELLDKIGNGDIAVDSFQRALATSEIMPQLSKSLARILGPRGLMPNPKVGTVASTPEELLSLLEAQLSGKDVQYRTEKQGIVHVPIGKGSFEFEHILENAGAVMKELYQVKPDTYGKKKASSKSGGKKGGSGSGKAESYILSAYVSSTFGPGHKIDLRTLDPSSAFFLTEVEAYWDPSTSS